MHKYTGQGLSELRDLIALCDGSLVIYGQERAFIADMARRAKQSAMILSDKQNTWLLTIIDRVVTDRGLFGSR